MSPAAAYPLADLGLARRLERAEGRRNAAFVDSRAALQPELGACWTEVAGTLAMFDGVDSPITQTFGLGMFATIGPDDLDTLERFFRDRDSDVFHEVSPLADASLWPLLGDRGYRPIEFTSLLVRPVSAELPPSGDDGITVRPIEPGEEDLWARVSAEGWGETAEIVAFVLAMGEVAARCRHSLCFLAELDGRPVASAALGYDDGVATLAGASTIPSARNRGAQRALLRERLRVARELGCDLALMGALPGSTSQKNAERQGFRIAYTRVKWQRRVNESPIS